ncbi:DUF262 domain-containing protein [Brevundimonas vesicularis]|uniref:DUF262 domain-containing protein n=1 Tax=Brevundimonas vesicularis TaxID=41276 RepID=UPI0030C3EBA7
MVDVPAGRAATYQPNKRTIGQLLSMASPHIVVPDWQRSYSWTQPHVETFWNDLTRFDRRHPGVNNGEYFLGSIVLVSGVQGKNLLLDGQQRVATSAILLSSIRDFILAYNANAAVRLQSNYLADFDDAANAHAYKLTLNEYDREYFKRLILEYREGNYTPPVAQYPSHQLICDARSFFDQALIDECRDMNAQQAFQRALRIRAVLTDMMSVIEVSSVDEDSAADVFETLNDRGIGLSTPDLLRNLLMKRANAANRPQIVDLWRDVLQFESDNKIKSFLRHYWVSNHGDVKTQSLYREIKDYILDNDIDSVELSRQLNDASDVYREIVAGRDENEAVQSVLRDILLLGASSSVLYPYILAVKQSVPADRQLHLIDQAINAYIRHSVIGQRDNSRLENVLYSAARSLRRGADPDAVRQLLLPVIPDDAELVTAFERLSITQRGVQRYLLRKLEAEKRRTEELDVALPNRVHVEHIYPQTPSAEDRHPHHDRILNRIGNLTLLSARLNAALRNSGFAAKKVRYQESDLELTRELLNLEDWTAETIANRQAALAQLTPAIWPV